MFLPWQSVTSAVSSRSFREADRSPSLPGVLWGARGGSWPGSAPRSAPGTSAGASAGLSAGTHSASCCWQRCPRPTGTAVPGQRQEQPSKEQLRTDSQEQVPAQDLPPTGKSWGWAETLQTSFGASTNIFLLKHVNTEGAIEMANQGAGEKGELKWKWQIIWFMFYYISCNKRA